MLLRSLVRIAGTPLPHPWEFAEEGPYHALFTSADDASAIGDRSDDDDAWPDAESAARIPVQGPLESERLALLLDTLKRELPRLAASLAAETVRPDAQAQAPTQASSSSSSSSSAATSASFAQSHVPGQARTPSPTPTVAERPSTPDDGAAVMRRLTSRDRTTPFAWMDGHECVIVVHPAARTWHAPGLAATAPAAPAARDLAARLLQGELHCIELTPDDMPDETVSPAHRLELLLWHVGLLVSPEGVLPEVRRTRRLRLARWPDFGSFGSDALQLKLSAFLVSRSYSIDELLLAAGGAGERVVAFLNACALCGLFVGDTADERPDPRESSAPRQFGDVMRMVRSALGMAQG